MKNVIKLFPTIFLDNFILNGPRKILIYRKLKACHIKYMLSNQEYAYYTKLERTVYVECTFDLESIVIYCCDARKYGK
jgi:hypothetical protein